MVMASDSVKERIEEARKLLDEAEQMAEPSTMSFSGTLRFEQTDRGVIIHIEREENSSNVIPLQPERKKRGRKAGTPRVIGDNILNTSALPDFKGFVLRNGQRTRRASMVLKAYNIEPSNVPGRQIIDWAKTDERHAKEVKVDVNGTLIPLSQFVADKFSEASN